VGATVTPGIALATLTLVQAFIPNGLYNFGMNGPSWSLSCEAFFYALFPALIVLAVRFGRARLLVLPLLILAIMAVPAVSSALPAHDRAWFVYLLPPVRLLEFGVGILLALEVKAGRWPRIPIWLAALLAAGAYGLAAAPSHFYPGPESNLAALAAVTIIPYALLIAACAQADISGRSSFFGRRWMIRLGEWSFAFYLVHGLWIEGFNKVAGHYFNGTAGIVAECVIMLALSTVTAAVVYSFYERPLERRLRHSTRRSALALEST
jgi:peptidoglycan/LPS O-acetylase OafA/YrhL